MSRPELSGGGFFSSPLIPAAGGGTRPVPDRADGRPRDPARRDRIGGRRRGESCLRLAWILPTAPAPESPLAGPGCRPFYGLTFVTSGADRRPFYCGKKIGVRRCDRAAGRRRPSPFLDARNARNPARAPSTWGDIIRATGGGHYPGPGSGGSLVRDDGCDLPGGVGTAGNCQET